MRFEFDENGYVCCIFEGCFSGICVEYEGLVPTEPEEYLDMYDWAERAQTRAYKLNEEGNLIYDAERAEILRAEEERGTLGVVDIIYPVGSIYMTVNDVSPEILFGGSWERIEDRFLLAAGAISAGNTGGAESYDLSIDAHKHTISTFDNVKFVSGAYTDGTFDIPITGTTEKSGSVSKTIPTMPPYLAVFVWKRTA